MSSKQRVTVTFGKANFERAMATLAAFLVAASWDRSTAINYGRVNPRDKVWYPATNDPEHGKGFTSVKIEYEEGSILLFQARRTRGGMTIADAGVFVRLRSSAPLISLLAALPPSVESMLGDNIMAFQGRGDILSVDELRTLGIEVPRSYVSIYMDEDEVEERFSTREIASATVERPTFVRVATTTGTKAQAVAADPIRRVRLRRQ